MTKTATAFTKASDRGRRPTASRRRVSAATAHAGTKMAEIRSAAAAPNLRPLGFWATRRMIPASGYARLYPGGPAAQHARTIGRRGEDLSPPPCSGELSPVSMASFTADPLDHAVLECSRRDGR